MWLKNGWLGSCSAFWRKFNFVARLQNVSFIFLLTCPLKCLWTFALLSTFFLFFCHFTFLLNFSISCLLFTVQSLDNFHSCNRYMLCLLQRSAQANTKREDGGHWKDIERVKNQRETGPKAAGYYCCSVAKSCLTQRDPTDCSTPGFPVLHCLPEFAQTHVHWVSDDIQPSHPLSSPCPPAFNLFQHPGLF